mmetsp:Transcript_7986/g.19422  ORF Transcript_7986/g.19422 Transcript_7986/m.19422 type:complete len:219 (+) Transcript_7986:189-845(+)
MRNPRRGLSAVGNGETQLSLKRLKIASAPDSPDGPFGTTDPGGNMMPPEGSNHTVVIAPAARDEPGATVRVSAEVYVDQTAREIWRVGSVWWQPHSWVASMGQSHAHETLTGHAQSHTIGRHWHPHDRKSQEHDEQLVAPSVATASTPAPEQEQLVHEPTASNSGPEGTPDESHSHSVWFPASFMHTSFPTVLYSVGGWVTIPVVWSQEHPEQLNCSM